MLECQPSVPHVQAIQKNAEPMAHDLTQRVVQPASQAAKSAEPAARQLADDGIRPAAKIVAENAEPSEHLHGLPALSCMAGLLSVHALQCTSQYQIVARQFGWPGTSFPCDYLAQM